MAALTPSVPIGVVGAGTMGAGIAQVAAAAGHPVLLCDAVAGAVEGALARIASGLDRALAKGRVTETERAGILARIRLCRGLDALSGAGLAIEAIVEELDAKREVFEALEVFLGDDAILASNTSSFSITALAARRRRPGRIVGMHFFNPAPRMPLVEVVHGLESAPEVVATVIETARAWGKTPVEARSTPGFIVNRIARPFYGEALRAVTEQAADPATIDAVLREAGGFRMGPFELMDLIGLDVNLAVSRSIHGAHYGDPRYAPSLLQEEMVAAGRLGEKSGRGFYDHAPASQRPAPATAPPAPPPESVVIEGRLGGAEALVERIGAAGIAIERRERGDGPSCILIGDAMLMPTGGRSATGEAFALASPVVLLDLALDYATCPRLAVAAADQCTEADRAAAIGLLQACDIAVSPIDDHPGLLVMRTVCMLANEAADAVRLGVASAADVDTAMRLGVNYPLGPLAWAERIGLDRVVATLDALAFGYGEDRYRTSPLLRRRAWAGGSFHD